MFDTKKTKDFDLGTFGKILYFTGVIKLNKRDSEHFKGVKVKKVNIRVLHPAGFILLLICFFSVGFDGVRENWKDDFCII